MYCLWFISFLCLFFVGFYFLIPLYIYIRLMGYWGSFSFAFSVLYFCLIQCFCHLVAEKGFEIKVNEVNIFKLSFPLLGSQEKK